MIPVANNTLAALTVLGQILIIALVLALAAKKEFFPVGFIKPRALDFSFLIALAAALGSLFYSNVAGYEPCVLCWYQRIFLYPQVFILGLASIKKDFLAAPYVMLLSAVDAAIAGYQYLLQLNWLPSAVCSAETIDCARRYVTSFGYITLPLMSFTAFVLIALILAVGTQKHNKQRRNQN